MFCSKVWTTLQMKNLDVTLHRKLYERNKLSQSYPKSEAIEVFNNNLSEHM